MGIVNDVHSILMKGQRMMGFKLFEDVYFIIFHGQVGSIAKTLGCRAVVVVTDPGLRFTFQIKTKNKKQNQQQHPALHLAMINDNQQID